MNFGEFSFFCDEDYQLLCKEILNEEPENSFFT